jgi:Flp pilus assembly protein TadD
MLATCPDASVRDGAKALEVARLLVQGSRQPVFLDTLAAAYAETGQFAKARATAEEALALAESSGRTIDALSIQTHLRLYRIGRPYRETPERAKP